MWVPFQHYNITTVLWVLLFKALMKKLQQKCPGKPQPTEQPHPIGWVKWETFYKLKLKYIFFTTRHVGGVIVNSLFHFHVLIVVTSTFMFWLLPLSLSCSHHQECWVEWFSPHTSFSITCLAPSFTGCYHSLEKYNFPFNDFGTKFYTICFFSAVVTASFILGSKVITYLP